MASEVRGEPMPLAWDKKDELEEEAQAQVDIWKYIFGYVEQAVVKCAIELGIADAIESQGSPMTLSEISSKLGCNPSNFSRIMRFLTHRKIFKAIPTNNNGIAYANTPLSRRLLRNGQNSVAAFVLLESSPVMLAPWHSLSARVLANGKSSFEKAHGEDVWQYAAEHPEHSNLIDEAMACDTRMAVPAVIKGCSEAFEGLKTLVDVGGGNATTLSIVVDAFTSIRGINFDLPHVIAVAPPCDRVEHVAGDMFSSVPKADAVFLKWVLHDWGDEESIQILKKCREAIPKENGRVVIVEAVIEEGGINPGDLKEVGLTLDMTMLAHTNVGKERTLKEWDYVIQMAGFSSYTVKAIHAVQSVIMAFP